MVSRLTDGLLTLGAWFGIALGFVAVLAVIAVALVVGGLIQALGLVLGFVVWMIRGLSGQWGKA